MAIMFASMVVLSVSFSAMRNAVFAETEHARLVYKAISSKEAAAILNVVTGSNCISTRSAMMEI